MENSDIPAERSSQPAAENTPDARDSTAASGGMPTDDVDEALSSYSAMTDEEASGDGDGDNDINITESNGPFLEVGDDLDTGAGRVRRRD
ncbi:MAG TPA: hypothetical protein VFT01_05235 [Homoserinimonas sp.]|nr:hypothetical protein [Homoserinimonas sp.]